MMALLVKKIEDMPKKKKKKKNISRLVITENLR